MERMRGLRQDDDLGGRSVAVCLLGQQETLVDDDGGRNLLFDKGGASATAGDILTKYYNRKAEILKMCEVNKLKSKPSDEELPVVRRKQQIIQLHNIAQGRRSNVVRVRKCPSNDVQDDPSDSDDIHLDILDDDHALTHDYGILKSRLISQEGAGNKNSEDNENKGAEPPMNIVTGGQGSQNGLVLGGEAVAQRQVGRSSGHVADINDTAEENADHEMAAVFQLGDIKQEQLDDDKMEDDDVQDQELDEQDHFVEEIGDLDYNMPGADYNLEVLEGYVDLDLDPPNLKVTGYFCGYCGVFIRGHMTEMDKHMMGIHTAAYYTKRHVLPASTTDKDMDRVILALCGRQGLLRTFRCSFCNKSISGQGKRHHLLKEHFQLVESTLLERMQLDGQVQHVADNSEQLRPVTCPEIAEVPTNSTKLTRQRRIDKEDFDKNRTAYKSDPSKPRFEYSFLIKQAIAESRKKRLKLDEICWWLRANFGYFRIPRVKDTLHTRISSALSNGKCFVRVDPKNVKDDGEWKLKGKEFYKTGRKWSSAPPATTVTLPRPPPYVANGINENLEEAGDASSFQQASSSGNEHHQQLLPSATQGEGEHVHLADIQNEGVGEDGANGNNGMEVLS